MAFRVRAVACVVVFLFGGCGDDDPSPDDALDAGQDSSVVDASDAAPDASDAAALLDAMADGALVNDSGVDADVDASAACRAYTDCDDGVYCNGIEGCDPTSPVSDERGASRVPRWSVPRPWRVWMPSATKSNKLASPRYLRPLHRVTANDARATPKTERSWSRRLAAACRVQKEAPTGGAATMVSTTHVGSAPSATARAT